MSGPSIPEIETSLFLEALKLRHGYDFGGYSPKSLRRRLETLLADLSCDSLLALLPRLLHDESFVQIVIAHLSVPVTEMFRDPALHLTVRDQVVPFLATYPRMQIWLPGCATGEEAYSLAILLSEMGVLHHATLFATDINDQALAVAEAGCYPRDRIEGFARNYRLSGGLGAIGDYVRIGKEGACVVESIRQRIVFAHHNLVTDGIFAETHLIYCANVLIYFNNQLRNRVLKLFHDSLVPGGFLCLGSQESLAASVVRDAFVELDPLTRVYRARYVHPSPART
ncbi:MAG: hypothetical protein H7834_06825 [Magnetococcus sp. YQC-9]